MEKELKGLQKEIHKGFERVEKRVVEVDAKLGKQISEVATRVVEVDAKLGKQISEVAANVEVLDKSAREIFGYIQKDMQETKTDIESLKVMSANHFAETMSRFDKVTHVLGDFVKMHEILDTRVADLERRMARLEHLAEA